MMKTMIIGAATALTLIASGGMSAAAADGPLGEAEIRQLLSGRTAQWQRQRGPRTIFISLSFGADGSVRHRCTAQRVNVGAHSPAQCRTPNASGTWSVAGRRLCLDIGSRRCYLVIRAGGGYIFRPRSGTPRPYGGRFALR